MVQYKRIPALFGLPALLGSVCLVAACADAPASGGSGSDTVVVDTTTPPTVAPWIVFELDSLRAVRDSLGVTHHTFLNEPTLVATLARPPGGGAPVQLPFGQLLYVLNGTATVRVGPTDISVDSGTAVFVRGGVDHTFENITNLELLVLVSKTGATGAGPDATSWNRDEITAMGNHAQNTWNPFLKEATMIFGMYMLPSSRGGDGSLTHAWDELNLVVAGASRFIMGGDGIDIEPGTLMFVREGVGHRFNSLSSDLEVLILWNQP